MKKYLIKKYEFRRWETLLAGIISSLFGGIPLIYFGIPSVIKADYWANFKLYFIPGAIFVFGIPALLLFAGLWLAYSWFTKRVNTLEISDLGIKYGSKSQLWNQIKWFSWYYSKRKKPTLFYQKKGFSFDHNLMVTDSLTEEEIEDLFNAIEKDILPNHRNLKIG